MRCMLLVHQGALGRPTRNTHPLCAGCGLSPCSCYPPQAALSLCMLLVLKKYLREAYSLADERVAAYDPKQAAVRLLEEKAPVARVSRGGGGEWKRS